VAGDAESEMEALVDERRHFGRHYAVGESLLAILTSTDESPGLLLQWPPLPIDVDEQYAISERIAGGTIEDLLQLGTPASHRAALAWALETAPSDIQQEVLFRAVDQLYAVPDAEDLFRDIIDASAHILPAGDRANLLAPFAESFIRHDTGIALYSAYAASPAHHWLFESGLESRYVHARAAAVACAGMLPDEAELIPRIEEMAGVETSPVVLAAMPEALLAKGAASGLETLAARLETPSPALVPYVRLAQGLSPTPERFTDLKLAVEEGDSSDRAAALSALATMATRSGELGTDAADFLLGLEPCADSTDLLLQVQAVSNLAPSQEKTAWLLGAALSPSATASVQQEVSWTLIGDCASEDAIADLADNAINVELASLLNAILIDWTANGRGC